MRFSKKKHPGFWMQLTLFQNDYRKPSYSIGGLHKRIPAVLNNLRLQIFYIETYLVFIIFSN